MNQPPDFWCDLAHKVIDLLTPTSSAKLATVMDICRALEPIKEPAETAAVNLALAKQTIPGYTLVRLPRQGYVEASAVLALLENLPMKEFIAVLPELLSWFGSLSEKRYQELCELLKRDPDKAVLKSTGDTVYLRKNPQS